MPSPAPDWTSRTSRHQLSQALRRSKTGSRLSRNCLAMRSVRSIRSPIGIPASALASSSSSRRLSRRFGSAASVSARSGRPSARRERRRACSSSVPRSRSAASISPAATRPNSIFRQRDRTVGRRSSSCVRDQDEDGVRRRFFERLEKCVLRAGRHGVRRIDDGDAGAALEGGERDGLLDLAHLVDADVLVLNAVFGRGNRDGHDVRVDAAGDARALGAFAAWRRRRPRFARSSRPARASGRAMPCRRRGAGEEPRVRRRAAREGALDGGEGAWVADEGTASVSPNAISPPEGNVEEKDHERSSDESKDNQRDERPGEPDTKSHNCNSHGNRPPPSGGQQTRSTTAAERTDQAHQSKMPAAKETTVRSANDTTTDRSAFSGPGGSAESLAIASIVTPAARRPRASGPRTSRGGA